MDLTFLIPILFSIVSATIALVTLWLTQFRGPDIALLNPPKEFEVDNEPFERAQKQDYTPRWIQLKPISFVFANHGGKSGMLIDMKLNFIPHTKFKDFFHEVSYHFGEPVVIKKGEIEHIKVNPSIHIIEWKKNTLAKILDQTDEWSVDDVVSKAFEESKERFEDFCDFLEKSEKLGELSCIATMTKGRFRTKVRDETLLKNVGVSIGPDKPVALLRNCLSRWEILEPANTQLKNDLRASYQGIKKELKENLSILKVPVDENRISPDPNKCKLRVQAWKSLRQMTYEPEKTILWALIRKKKGQEHDLMLIYDHIMKYNRSIDDLTYLGEQRTEKSFQKVNAERETLISEMRPHI